MWPQQTICGFLVKNGLARSIILFMCKLTKRRIRSSSLLYPRMKNLSNRAKKNHKAQCLKIPKKKYNIKHSHYSKSQIFVQKFNFDKTPTHFHGFSPQIFLTIFLVKSKLSTAKKSETTTFSRVFHPKKSTIFSGNQS